MEVSLLAYRAGSVGGMKIFLRLYGIILSRLPR